MRKQQSSPHFRLFEKKKNTTATLSDTLSDTASQEETTHTAYIYIYQLCVQVYEHTETHIV